MDAVAKNTSTSFFGAIVSIAESPVRENFLYVGTDDGLIHVSEDGGSTWRKIETFPGVPEMTFVSTLIASRHAVNTVYAGFNNYKAGDFKPYLLKSADGGKNWTSIAGNLPERGSVWSIAEDHVNPDLLFAGTEFGAYFTVDGGKKWIKLSGLPTIPVRDIAIHRKNNDLVLATFGRGFWIVDAYSPLRQAARTVEQRVALLPVPPAEIYGQASPLGGGPRGSQGDALYTARNPGFGATFTWYLAERSQILAGSAPGGGKSPRRRRPGRAGAHLGHPPRRRAGGAACGHSHRQRRAGKPDQAADRPDRLGIPPDRMGLPLPCA